MCWASSPGATRRETPPGVSESDRQSARHPAAPGSCHVTTLWASLTGPGRLCQALSPGSPSPHLAPPACPVHAAPAHQRACPNLVPRRRQAMRRVGAASEAGEGPRRGLGGRQLTGGAGWGGGHADRRLLPSPPPSSQYGVSEAKYAQSQPSVNFAICGMGRFGSVS